MNNTLEFGARPTAATITHAPVEIFDAPMCCPTGMCGPTIDPALLDVNEMVLTLQNEGIGVVRYQLGSHSKAFANNRAVLELVRTRHLAALPITVVNGTILQVGAYPTLAQVRAALTGTEIN